MGGGAEHGTVSEYDPSSRAYRLSYDPDDERELSTVVDSADSKLRRVSIEQLELNSVVHPGALNLLFSDRPNGAPRERGTLVFTLAGCEVTLEGGGRSCSVSPGRSETGTGKSAVDVGSSGIYGPTAPEDTTVRHGTRRFSVSGCGLDGRGRTGHSGLHHPPNTAPKKESANSVAL